MSRRGRRVAVAAMLVAACTGPPRDGAPAGTSTVDAASPSPAATTPASSSARADAATARLVCADLVALVDEAAAAVDGSIGGISGHDPTTRASQLADGFRAVAAVLDDHAAGLAALELPDVAEAPSLRAELVAGARAARQELDDEAERLADELDGRVEDGDVPGRVGQFFNAVEKALSLAEADLAGQPRPGLRHAFADEPRCRHVVQPVGDGG